MRSTQRMAVLHAIFRLRAGTAIAIAVARAAVAIVGVAQLTSEDCLNVFHLSFAEKIVYQSIIYQNHVLSLHRHWQRWQIIC